MARATFADAVGYCVRYLVRSATGMAANSVRPADQAAPTLTEGEEFASVKIMGLESDFGTESISFEPDPTVGTTKVIENVDSMYRFTASVQFFRHSTPTRDGVGLSPFAMGAFDRAARLPALLATSATMDLMDTMGIGLEDTSPPRNLSSLINGAVWDDRGSIDLDMTVFNRESVLVNFFNQAGIVIEVAQPGQPTPDTVTIEVYS